MRKFTLSVLILLVSVFFMGQTALGQAMHSKTLDIVKTAIPVVDVAKATNDFDFADMYSIDFEDEVDWTFDFTPWIAVDADGLTTYTMTGITWPHGGEPQAFIVFNTATTDPPTLDDPELQPYEGDKFGACLAAVPDGALGNDDWFISDMVSLGADGKGASFNFWAKTYTDQYGLERFNVGVSTTGTAPADFTIISGATYIEAPMAWTEYNYDLSAYAGMDVYVAIQCVSYDAFIFMIDNLVIDPGAAGGDCENFDALTTGLGVADQLGGLWTTWSGGPADDAMVTDVQSNSPDNSFVVDAGAIDLIRTFGDDPISAGMWMYSHYMYVPTGFSGYFNVQTDPTPGIGWNLEVFFDDDGTGYFAGQSTETYVYDMDTWFMVEIMYDLDQGIGRVYFDGALIVEFVNAMTIGGIDYFGADTGGDPGAYYDDVCFAEVIPPGNCDDFDALTAGLGVADQLSGRWTTWSGGPADDAMVTDAQSNSPDNSFVVDAGAIDLIRTFGDDPISAGMWMYSHYMYVPTGFSGYFNVQTDPTPGIGWNLDLYFDDDGTGHFDGQSTEVFDYTPDTWFMVEIIYDFDAGTGQVLFDGVIILDFVNTLTIGGIDYYGADTGGDPGAYYDDVCFMEYIPPPDCDNFDALTVGLGVADQLGGLWTTWSGGPADDAMVSDVQSYSPDNSFVVDAGAIDLIRQFGAAPISAGQWLYSHYMYVPTGFSGYFNVQTDPTPGIGWNLDLYFDDDGTGHFDGQSTEVFDYTPDTWFMVEINYDLDAGLAQVLFDGVVILEFVNTLTIGGIDYYGADSGGDPGAYYDDVCFGIGWEIVGIDEGFFMPNTISVYPNPASSRITIESESIIDEVMIYNNMGQLVYSGQFDNNQIMVNTSTFITGMYIVQVRSGEAVEIRKLIIE